MGINREKDGSMDALASRRGFLKGAGAALAGGALLGLAGCAPSGAGAAGQNAGAGEVAWDEEYDVVVVGAGIAGLATAVTISREGNGESCLVIEKDATPNGNSPFVPGTCSTRTMLKMRTST